MRRHLRLRSGSAACGLADPTRSTTNLADVTCLGCCKSIHMADAEIRQQTASHCEAGRHTR